MGLWQFWDQVNLRPITATILIASYEVGLFLIAFGKKVWGKLEDEAVTVTADWIRNAIRGFAPGFRRRYSKQILNIHSIFNVRGLGLLNTYTLRLDQVFVDLRIIPGNPEDFNLDPITKKRYVGNRPIWDFLKKDRSKNFDLIALAIIGPPGCGKTTLLQYIALTLSANRQRRYNIRAYAPILLFLRDHIATITEQRPTLGELAQDYFSDTKIFPNLKPPHRWFQKQLKRGKCLVLLDGLDEVADLQQRKFISRWIDTQIKSYPTCRYLLTARPQGYRESPLESAHILEVQPFSANQVQRFIENWYLANEIMSSGNQDDESVRQRANKDAKDLLDRLSNKSSLHELTVNPLLLTMITMVHRYRGALPGSRVELYAEICEVLLGRWRQTKGVQDYLQAGQKLHVLRPLAAHMMKSKERDILTRDVIAVITPLLEMVDVRGTSPIDFLKELQANSGLILERESGRWSFAHLTFQEYLTAANWLEKKEENIDWVSLVNDSWWNETLRLFAAQGNATALIDACLTANSTASLTLAAECLEEARALDPTTRRKAEEHLIGGIESSAKVRRRLAAEVRLARRLKGLRPLDSPKVNIQCEIDGSFITCAEYQLFLDDAQTQGRFCQPDHWNSLDFKSGEALSSLSGVRASCAIAFCEWLTKHLKDGWIYRLPQPNEANQSEANTGELGAITTGGQAITLSGLTEVKKANISSLLGIILGETIFAEVNCKQISDQAGGSIFDIACFIDDAVSLATNKPFGEYVISSLSNHLRLNIDNYPPAQIVNVISTIFGLSFYYHYDLSQTTVGEITNREEIVSSLAFEAKVSFGILIKLRDAFLSAFRFRDAANLTGELGNIRNFARELNRVIRISREFDASLKSALAYINQLDPYFNSITALDINLVSILSSKFAFTDTLSRAEESITKTTNYRGVSERDHSTATSLSQVNFLRTVGLDLVHDILEAINAKTPVTAHWAHIKYITRLLEYAYLGSQGPEKSELRFFWQQWLMKPSKLQDKKDSLRFTLVTLLSWLKIIQTRMERTDFCWEGIRIVRERQLERGDNL